MATGTSDFPSLRRDGKIYVDTEYVHKIVCDPSTRL